MSDTFKAEGIVFSEPHLISNGNISSTGPTTQVPLSPVSRLEVSSKRTSKKNIRPSTAPAADEYPKDFTLKLPALLQDESVVSFDLPSESLGSNAYRRPRRNEMYASSAAVGEGCQDDELGTISEGLPAPPSGYFPSPFDDSAREDTTFNGFTAEPQSHSSEPDYDWATFIPAYASGRWDPRKTPKPPRSRLPAAQSISLSEISSIPTYSIQSTEAGATDNLSSQQVASPTKDETKGLETLGKNDVSHVDIEGSVMSSPSPHPTTPISRSLRTGELSLNLPPASHRFRSSFADIRSPLDSDSPSIPSSSPGLTAAAATMRWAAARVNLAPLSLPSPEHELTDPMRGVTAAIPGSHPPQIVSALEAMTPGGTRRSRLTSFWEGTQDIDDSKNQSARRLSTVQASPPPVSVSQSPESSATSSQRERYSLPFPASAPLQHCSDNSPDDDYFADFETCTNASLRQTSPRLKGKATTPPYDMATVSAPALPYRIILNRQTSSPLPESSTPELRPPRGRIVSTGISPPHKVSKTTKEEDLFGELGYLAPPYPPDEVDRRRALYKFNIWHTGPDLNFDRIAHLAKLVFNTRGALISLIDANEQWYKSEWGVKGTNCPRTHSFCAHAILQRDDEPMVILDTLQDWRFAKNPLVENTPSIRFYAGAPLRTSDGYNIGSLSILDDSPRRDFTPRQRHTLKEFAAIAMREMELWRDKIQLRIRDRIQNSMEQFSRECLEIDTEAHTAIDTEVFVGASMDRVYDRAAKLVKRTLDVEGVVVMDVSHCEVLETMGAEGSVSVVLHYGDPQHGTTTRALSADEYSKLNAFFTRHPDGKISEGIVPPSLRSFLPTRIQYALTVPIFNIDKRPFALLCAYNASEHTKRFLEGHELSYLRAIGVIILSAVLKRRMILADKAKSLFISNISHELRTPLHGILAAAELLSETHLNHSQMSFLQTVQACGTSLVETVNHVLDFTKLSGNSKAGGVEKVIIPTKVDLMQLVEEAVDGCWIGHRARTSILRDSEIGSVYSPEQDPLSVAVSLPSTDHVETVVDIGRRAGGWNIMCEKGGIRRVLMNLFGNSLKFTSNGYVHVALRQLPNHEETPQNRIKVELAISDTGKGISQNFLKNQLFHPFSQENPLQAGTGLGLAIVNSIIQSDSVGGKVDVWSEEGVGTEIKVHFLAEALEHEDRVILDPEIFKFDHLSKPPSVSLVAFDLADRGALLLHSVLCNYLVSWWGFEVRPVGSPLGDIVIVNEDPSHIMSATEITDTSRPFIILSSSRGSPQLMAAAGQYERIGGFCRVIYKPGGPSRLRAVLKLALHTLKISQRLRDPSLNGTLGSSGSTESVNSQELGSFSAIPRRNSDQTEMLSRRIPRPVLTSRSITIHPTLVSQEMLVTPADSCGPIDEHDANTTNRNGVSNSAPLSTISVGNGGTLLKTSIGSITRRERNFKVLVVEDNSILRSLLARWLRTKGYDYHEAVDGRDGVNKYRSEGPFDVVLLDLSMPVLDGLGATAEIREIESSRSGTSPTGQASKTSSRILALTGMSSLDDKRRAFEAGVDGYLVKPVAFKTLDEMFYKLQTS